MTLHRQIVCTTFCLLLYPCGGQQLTHNRIFQFLGWNKLVRKFQKTSNKCLRALEIQARTCKVRASGVLEVFCFFLNLYKLTCNSGYWTTSPSSGVPFLLGVETYNTTAVNRSRSSVQDQVLSKAWPLLILEAEGNYTVQATITCPTAGNFTTRS